MTLDSEKILRTLDLAHTKKVVGVDDEGSWIAKLGLDATDRHELDECASLVRVSTLPGIYWWVCAQCLRLCAGDTSMYKDSLCRLSTRCAGRMVRTDSIDDIGLFVGKTADGPKPGSAVQEDLFAE